MDEEVVVDGNLITSRNPDDLDAFSAAIVEQFARGEEDDETVDDRRELSPAAQEPRRAARPRGRSSAASRRRPGSASSRAPTGSRPCRCRQTPTPATSPVTASGASRTATYGTHLPEHGGGEVDADAGGQRDDQLAGEAQPGEGALLRGRVEVVVSRSSIWPGRTTGIGPVDGWSAP